ncbi:Hsp20/alpha crystallin family protein [Lentzea sp. NPDC006480]|uniref:Hsp20/alpha crystallin family protein n=1 Tax=Lentzea sp. NPDC006480 TaxID=3157176 RepID=UPI0033A6EE78
MTLMRFDPFRELDRLSEHTVRTPRALPMEAFRRGEECVVALDLPGVGSEDVDVTVERNVVTVKASRRPLWQEDDEVLIDERPHGEFSRQFFLGDMLDAANLSASFDRGVLVLTIPVAESSKPRQIEIS